MKVLVTGNLGYLGPLVVERLQLARHTVHGLDRGLYLHQLAERLTPEQLPSRQYFGDIRDYPGGKKYDVVVHLAGLSNDPMGDLEPDETQDVNVVGTLSMLERYHDAHHIFASSASVYGANDEIVSVGSATNPITEYAKSKLEVENVLRSDYTGNYSALRLGTLFGWAPNFRTDLVVNRMVYDVLNQKSINYNRAWRPLTHVAEAAFAIADVARLGPVGTKDVVQVSMTMGHLADLVAERAPNLDIKMLAAPTADVRDYRLRPTLKALPGNEIGDAISDLMKRRLPLNIRLDAYKEAQ